MTDSKLDPMAEKSTFIGQVAYTRVPANTQAKEVTHVSVVSTVDKREHNI